MLKCNDEEDGGDLSSDASSILTLSASICLPTCYPTAMGAISFFYMVKSPSQRALECEEPMVGMVPRGERDQRRRIAVMAGAAIYIAADGNGGRQMDMRCLAKE